MNIINLISSTTHFQRVRLVSPRQFSKPSSLHWHSSTAIGSDHEKTYAWSRSKSSFAYFFKSEKMTKSGNAESKTGCALEYQVYFLHNSNAIHLTRYVELRSMLSFLIVRYVLCLWMFLVRLSDFSALSNISQPQVLNPRLSRKIPKELIFG